MSKIIKKDPVPKKYQDLLKAAIAMKDTIYYEIRVKERPSDQCINRTKKFYAAVDAFTEGDEVSSDHEEFLESCKEFQPDDIGFDGIFESIVNYGVNWIEGLEDALIKKFEVDRATVRRWARGKAEPLPRFQKLVVKFIFKKATKSV